MTARRETYACNSCGHTTGKWMGFCPQCRGGGTMEAAVPHRGGRLSMVPLAEAAAAAGAGARLPIGIDEFDRVLGGGLVPGAVVMLGGDPGIGKSTLLLQAAAGLAKTRPVAYVTGEESVAQVAERARRVGADTGRLAVAAERDADVMAAAIRAGEHDVVVIDSIQTATCPDLATGTGGVSQMREAAARIIAAAKDTGVSVFLVGHVTKDGTLAGPRQVEHMVDVVLHLEGDETSGLRYLRGVKNRYGSIDRIGIFAMEEEGMTAVSDPSALFAGAVRTAPGSVLFPAVHGRRAVMVEVQALVAPSPVTTPRRAIRGLEVARVHQIVAVLERHAGFRFHDREVFVSVVGGLRITDPAVDLPVALALASAHVARPLDHLAAFGELGLTGEIRTAHRAAARLEEVQRLGDVDVAHAGTFGSLSEVVAATGVGAPAEVVRIGGRRR